MGLPYLQKQDSQTTQDLGEMITPHLAQLAPPFARDHVKRKGEEPQSAREKSADLCVRTSRVSFILRMA